MTMRPTTRNSAHAILAICLLAGAPGCERRDPTAAEPAQKAATDAQRKLRVVTLTPSATELVHAVGASDLLVGVDQYSSYPPEVQKLPKVGDFLSPSLEGILALHPDIAVLDSVQERFAEKLNAVKIRVLLLPMQSFEDVTAGLRTVGEALGRADAGRAEVARLTATLAAAEERARAAAARAGKRPRVLFIVDRRPGALAGMVASGPGTYIDDLLRRAGVDNVLADAPVRFVNIAVEEILQRAPDIILDAVHTEDATRARRDWDVLASVPAVAGGRVHVLADPLFVTPGPRLDQAFSRLVDILWPAK
jgi:iron complex transport system substrate-binding protein